MSNIKNLRLAVQPAGKHSFTRFVHVEGEDILSGRFTDVVGMGKTAADVEAFAKELVARWNAVPVLLALAKHEMTPGMFDALVMSLGLSAVPDINVPAKEVADV